MLAVAERTASDRRDLDDERIRQLHAAWLVGRMLTARRKVSTVALLALVATQLGQTMAVRGRTPLVLGAGAASLLALAPVVQIPGLSQLFDCRPLAPHSWAIALSCAALAGLVSFARCS